MTSDLNALREGLAEPIARDLAREGGWQDPDAPWTENQVIIARGGAGDPVWREYLDDARSLLGREALTSVLSDLAAARAEIDRLAAENAALREALRPFAEAASLHRSDAWEGTRANISVSDLRAARTALTTAPAGAPAEQREGTR